MRLFSLDFFFVVNMYIFVNIRVALSPNLNMRIFIVYTKQIFDCLSAYWR